MEDLVPVDKSCSRHQWDVTNNLPLRNKAAETSDELGFSPLHNCFAAWQSHMSCACASALLNDGCCKLQPAAWTAALWMSCRRYPATDHLARGVAAHSAIVHCYQVVLLKDPAGVWLTARLTPEAMH